jgi:hypothetical protein
MLTAIRTTLTSAGIGDPIPGPVRLDAATFGSTFALGHTGLY